MPVNPFISQHANGPVVSNCSICLPYLIIPSSSFELVFYYLACLLFHPNLLRCNFSNYPHGKPRSREWMSLEQLIGHIQQLGYFPYFIFVQAAQRLDYLQLEPLWQPSNIVMRLDNCRRSFRDSAFDDIWIECALCKPVKRPLFCNNISKHVSKLFAYYLALCLRVCHAFQLAQKPLCCIDINQLNPEMVFEKLDHVFLFVLPQQAVVDKDAPEVVAYCPVHQCSNCSRVYAAADCSKHLFIAYLFSDISYGHIDKTFHVPLCLCAAYPLGKILEDLRAVFGMYNFGVELYPVESFLLVSDGS